MLRPAKMAKVTVVASKKHLRPIVEKLHAMGAVHLVDFSEGTDPAMEGFRIGRPLPEGAKASERLVRLRGLSRHLDLTGHEPTTRFPARELEARLDQAIHQLELNIESAAEAKSRIEASIEALRRERAVVEPLKALPLRLEDYSGYRSLAVFVGKAEASPEAALREATQDVEFFAAPGLFAAFVPKDHAGKAAEALTRAGAQLTEVPKASGDPGERIDAIGRELQGLEHRLAAATGELAKFRREHADFLVAAEEHLTIESEKADAPLSFATSEHAFVVEGWVPEEQSKSVYSALRQAVGDNFHLEVHRAEDLLAHAHAGHGAEQVAHEGAHEADEAGPAAEAPKALVPPTKFQLAKPFAPFRVFTEMVSLPKYGEIDPTPILALVLPIFLGIMIGDAGYGILMLAIGAWMYTKLRNAEELQFIGVAMAVSGLVSLVFGAVIFGDAFGIPLGQVEEPMLACADFVAEHGETTWACLTGISSLNDVHPLIVKLRDIGDLLIISVLAAFVHMALGLAFGVVNSWHHSKKHVVAKFGWFALMVGFFTQILYMAGPRFGPGNGNRVANAVYSALSLPTGSGAAIEPTAGLPLHIVLIVGVLLAVLLLAVGEGAMAVLELPSMLSNLISYTRLAGLAIAKGAMAAAFTSLTLVAMVVSNHGGALGLVLVLVGLVLFVFTQMFVFVLGVFSSGIQAIRLNYVEFFNKFYEGGGVAFDPFGKKRKYTQEG